MTKIYSPHLKAAKSYWKELLQSTDLAIDATCGNGHDTLFLSELCQVVGMDIQIQALKNTEALLAKHQKQAFLHLLSHAQIDTLPLPYAPRLIIYNLGYLPKGDKSITTQAGTTIESLQKSLALLTEGGALSITCYPGHEEGLHEEKAVEQWAAELPPDKWSVCQHKWLNRPRSPSLIWIVKLAGV